MADTAATLVPVTIGDLTGYAAHVENPDVPPVLLVHGLFGGAWYLERYQTALAALGFPSLAIDLRGHNGSRPVTDLGRVSILDYVTDARDGVQWLQQRYGQAPFVLGHSMGGLITQKLAESETLAAIVLLTPAPPRGVPLWNPKLLPQQVKYLPSLVMQRPLAPEPGDLADVAMNRVPEPERTEALRRHVPDSGRAAMEISFGLIGVAPDRVGCPVLCVAGRDDRFLPNPITRGIARRYRAPIWLFEGHGHFFIAEPGWERPLGDIARWMRHVAQLRSDPSFVADLWQGLVDFRGRVSDLTFFDDRCVRVEILELESGLRRGVRYRFLEQRDAGSVPFAPPKRGTELRAALHELRSVTPA